MRERCDQEFIPACWRVLLINQNLQIFYNCASMFIKTWYYWMLIVVILKIKELSLNFFILTIQHILIQKAGAAAFDCGWNLALQPCIPLLSLTDSETTQQMKAPQGYLHEAGWPGRPAAAQRSEGSSWPTPPGWTAACLLPDRCWWRDRWAE